ncbi:hypothetical protein BWQ96_09252 [Gracilariopsis chorda]|uniref:Uncharacterized protein n=1 Tax=Gracilariopsis chorda TaxID=448386 RepID=A0A2V3IG37_9FLOR|nr:hypothetical protein BWQ96_09252 [Gracilariopsis chorda]|eukprot:PXF41037.1 hypothetical protein BWQ96_09252 [Gracilariopsis chorda]
MVINVPSWVASVVGRSAVGMELSWSSRKCIASWCEELPFRLDIEDSLESSGD